MVQRRQECTALVPEGREEEESEDGIIMAADDAESDGDAATVVGAGGVQVTPGGAQATEEGEGG